METLKLIYKVLDNKKGENIVIYNIQTVSTIADYMIICTCTSEVHLEAVADELLYVMKHEKNLLPIAVDGLGRSRWVCIDFGDVIIHLMTDDTRKFYDLESIWGDCDRISIANEVNSGNN
ncbi:ribosome silencing factor [Deferribacter thermophilus]|uniref:ribosome silencing factor n=1 Tax=Deferribacter thermophilus TaxID=53573 RepID=UPI003C286352